MELETAVTDIALPRANSGGPVEQAGALTQQKPVDVGASAPATCSSDGDAVHDATNLTTESGKEAGYLSKLQGAVVDYFDSAKRAPQTLEEAMVVLRGETDIKPDFERAAYTVSAALGGGCVHGWWNGASLAAKYPRHQRNLVRVRAGIGKGVRFAAFALIFEGSSAALEALRRKRDFFGGAVGGGLAGMAQGVSGGLATARSGLFYGVWLGGLFGFFRNHVASLRDQARLAAEDDRRAQEAKDAIGKSALKKSIEGLNAQLETWPTTQEDTAARRPSTSRRD